MSDDIGQTVIDRIAATQQIKDFGLKPDNILADVLDAGRLPPAIVVSIPNAAAEEDLNSANRLFHSHVDVLAYGRDRKEANALAKLIRDYALPADLRGSVNGMDVKECSLTSGPAALMDRPFDGSDQFRRLTKQTFTIWASPL